MLLKNASLTNIQRRIIRDKATEYPTSGLYNSFDQPGTYLCRGCGFALFRGTAKFHSGCGWPSFDEEIPSAVKRSPDADGQRTEILCARCDGHLGHVFIGEKFTDKNVRHCVNSVSLDFVADQQVLDTEEAIVAGGCFWGVEYFLKKLPGVLKTEVGYSGGTKNEPSYQEVCEGRSGHFEAIRIVYDPTMLTYEQLLKYFFEIHDPEQITGQGPDLGQQYLSAIFCYNEKQKKIAEHVIYELSKKGLSIATKLLAVATFWPAEEFHQDYYKKTGKQPYCHHYQKRF